VALINDRLIIDLTWSGRDWWEQRCLEYDIYRTRQASEEFFARAELARRERTTRDALEVFVIAVLLGFRGKYRKEPAKLKAWLREQQDHLRLNTDPPEWADSAAEVDGARPLVGRAKVVWASIVAALAGAMALMALYAWVHVSTGSS